MPTIKDVAKYANVSIGTVSKYLNGITIREDNRQRIDAAIHALHYHVNSSARALKTNRTNTVAVLLPDIAGSYYPLIVKEIEYELYKVGYTVLIVDSHNSEVERRKIRLMNERMVDGFIVFPLGSSSENYREILEQKLPLCIVDQYLPELSCAQVVSDNVLATYNAAASLFNRGHQRVAIITGSPENTTAAERLRGYRMALESFSLSPEPRYIFSGGFEERHGREGMASLLSLPEPPTAVIACNHHITLGAVMYLLDHGLSIPHDMDLIGFDYEQLPKLTRMHFDIVTQNIRKIACACVAQLMQQINDPETVGVFQLQRIPTLLSKGINFQEESP